MTVVGGLELRRGDVGVVVGDLAVETPVVEPVDVAQGGVLDVVEALPGALGVDQLPLVETVEALGEGVVIAVAAAADRGDDVVGGQAFGVANCEVLDAPVRTNRNSA